MEEINKNKLNRYLKQDKQPFIVFDVITTNGLLDNKEPLQVALAAYEYDDKVKRYVLQDRMFVLVSYSNSTLKNIELENASLEKNLEYDFIHGLTKNLRKDTYKCLEYVERYKIKILNKQGDPKSETFKLETLETRKNSGINAYAAAKEKLDKTNAEIEENMSDILRSSEYQTFKKENTSRIEELMSNQLSMIKHLNSVGLSSKFIKDGLSKNATKETIQSFLGKWQTPETLFITNKVNPAIYALKKLGVEMPLEGIIDISRVIPLSVDDYLGTHKSTKELVTSRDALTNTILYGKMLSRELPMKDTCIKMSLKDMGINPLVTQMEFSNFATSQVSLVDDMNYGSVSKEVLSEKPVKVSKTVEPKEVKEESVQAPSFTIEEVFSRISELTARIQENKRVMMENEKQLKELTDIIEKMSRQETVKNKTQIQYGDD